MIEYYTGTPGRQEISKYHEALNILPIQLNTLTLERNAVLVARFSKDGGYDFEDMENMKRSLKEAFPNHTVLLTYDDIDFMAIEDKGYKAERIINDTSNYY